MNKACPVIIRERPNGKEILVFHHPLAGNQVVKGTIKSGETLKSACERELFEESGIKATCESYLGEWVSNYENQVWGFYLMKTKCNLPNNWVHFTEDGGGLEFSFFWRSLNSDTDDTFHPLFQGAISYINKRL